MNEELILLLFGQLTDFLAMKLTNER